MQQPLPATFHNGLPATIGPGPSVPAPGASMAGMTVDSLLQFAFAAAANAGNNSGGGGVAREKSLRRRWRHLAGLGHPSRMCTTTLSRRRVIFVLMTR
jgi:hypothetical protein